MVRQTTFLERYFWLSLCVLFLALFLPLLLRDWLSLQAEGLYDVEWHSTSLTKLLHRDLEHHRPLNEILNNLDDPELKRELDEHLQQKIGHLGLLMVKIYDRKGQLLLSTDALHATSKLNPDNDFQRALRGETVAKKISPEEYATEYGKSGKATMAEVMVPVETGSGVRPGHILEAYYDCGPILDRSQRLFQQRSFSLAATLLLVIGLLGWVLRSRQAMVRKVELLESILPICMHCKKIRVKRTEEEEEWVAMESYFHQKSAVDFSHGICDDCLQEHYPEVDAAKRKKTPG